MASAISHIVIPAVFYASFRSHAVNYKLFILAALLSILPDLDVIAFKFGIPYESQWGHRGFTHSFVFAFAVAALCALFYRQLGSRPWTVLWMCFIACASHAVLDAMTNGGLGVAFFWPFDPQRYFLPFRPLVVPPIGVARFFSEWEIRVIASELIWIMIPGLVLGALGTLLRRSIGPTVQKTVNE